MPQPGARRSIADRSWDVRQSLLDLLDMARTTEAPIQPQQAEDVLDRFKLWTGNLGALHQAHKRISLESRLADSPEVQDQICEQLDDMEEAIQDLLILFSETWSDFESNTKDGHEGPASAELTAHDLVPDIEQTSRKSEASSILRMVSECLKALFRIGILVRKATPRDRFERALQQSEVAFTSQFDIGYVEERYPKLASKESLWLASRLGGANAKRRQFINYGRDHKAKLEVEDVNPLTDAATTVQSSKATTFVVPENLSTSEFLHSPLEVDDDSVSLVSASTAFDIDTSLKLPSLADLSPDGEYFECPICFTLQSFRVEKSWKLHAYRDLRAYVCTSGGEECEHMMFSDRDSWFNHELEHHRALYLCKICESQYMDTKVLQQHLLDEHGPYSNEEILSVIEHGKLVPSQLKAQDCPFCDDWASVLSHRRHQTEGQSSSRVHQTEILVSLTHFKRHIATHQEQLAIFAVPRAVDSDEEHSHGGVEANSEAVSSKDDNSQMTDKEAHPMEELNYPHEPCVYLGGLPRGIREADVEAHFILNGFTGITDIKLMDDFAYIQLQDPHDIQRAIGILDGSTLMGARLNPRVARLPLDPFSRSVESVLAIDKLNSADNHFRTTLRPMCEEFIANPPSDPQKRQDQSTHLVTMVRQQVWSTANFIDAHDDQKVMARKAEILEAVGEILGRIRAMAFTNTRDAEKSTQDQDQGKIHHATADTYRVKLYKLHGNDWQDQGTGHCWASFVGTANERKEADMIVYSEEDPDRLLVEERVHEGDDFQRQQETLIVWTQRQTSIDMALSFQETTGCDAIWKIVDAVQRNDSDETEALPDRHDSLPDNSKSASSSDKKHKCPYCDAEFTRHHNLKSHLLTHSQEGPYLCQTCNQGFRFRYDLKRHSTAHIPDEKLHVCPKCDRKFLRAEVLARHSARHSIGAGGCAGRPASMVSDDDQGESSGAHRSEGDDASMALYERTDNMGVASEELGQASLPEMKTQLPETPSRGETSKGFTIQTQQPRKRTSSLPDIDGMSMDRSSPQNDIINVPRANPDLSPEDMQRVEDEEWGKEWQNMVEAVFANTTKERGSRSEEAKDSEDLEENIRD